MQLRHDEPKLAASAGTARDAHSNSQGCCSIEVIPQVIVMIFTINAAGAYTSDGKAHDGFYVAFTYGLAFLVPELLGGAHFLPSVDVTRGLTAVLSIVVLCILNL